MAEAKYTIDPKNPDDVSRYYILQKGGASPEEIRKQMLAKYNYKNGITNVQQPDGSVRRIDPYLSATNLNPTYYASSNISKGGSYATNKGISGSNDNSLKNGYTLGKDGIYDANGKLYLANPGGDWEYQYALRNPQWGLGIMGKMSDDQRNFMQVLANLMGFEYNYKGAPRFV